MTFSQNFKSFNKDHFHRETFEHTICSAAFCSIWERLICKKLHGALLPAFQYLHSYTVLQGCAPMWEGQRAFELSRQTFTASLRSIVSKLTTAERGSPFSPSVSWYELGSPPRARKGGRECLLRWESHCPPGWLLGMAHGHAGQPAHGAQALTWVANDYLCIPCNHSKRFTIFCKIPQFPVLLSLPMCRICQHYQELGRAKMEGV